MIPGRRAYTSNRTDDDIPSYFGISRPDMRECRLDVKISRWIFSKRLHPTAHRYTTSTMADSREQAVALLSRLVRSLALRSGKQRLPTTARSRVTDYGASARDGDDLADTRIVIHGPTFDTVGDSPLLWYSCAGCQTPSCPGTQSGVGIYESSVLSKPWFVLCPACNAEYQTKQP